jgi:hypothetical protein
MIMAKRHGRDGATNPKRQVRAGRSSGLAMIMEYSTWIGTAAMIISTYHHQRTVSRPDCPDLRVRKRGYVSAAGVNEAETVAA